MKDLLGKGLGLLLGSGSLNPLPGGELLKEGGKAIGNIKDLNNKKRLIKIGFALLGMVFVWYLIYKGMITSADQAVDVLKDLKVI